MSDDQSKLPPMQQQPDTDANANEGADPTCDIQKQNPGETTTADGIDKDDPHKTEKLANMGDAGDAAAGTE